MVKGDPHQQRNDYEVLDFLVKHVKGIVGLYNPNDEGKNEKRNPVDNLPGKVDEFMNFVARVYFKDDPKTIQTLENLERSRKSTRTSKEIFVAWNL